MVTVYVDSNIIPCETKLRRRFGNKSFLIITLKDRLNVGFNMVQSVETVKPITEYPRRF